jgi:hypothetical protein
MITKVTLAAAAMLLGATSAGWTQSQSGGAFGTIPSGTAASTGHYSGHSQSRSMSSSNSSSRDSGREVDATEQHGTVPTARQASTPQH